MQTFVQALAAGISQYFDVDSPLHSVASVTASTDEHCAADVQDISFTIYNKNKMTENTVIGTAVYPLAQAISTGFEESKVPVTTPEGAVKGSLHIRAIFQSKYTH